MASLKETIMQQLSFFVYQRLLAVAEEILEQVEKALTSALDREQPQGTGLDLHTPVSAAPEAYNSFADGNHPLTRPATQAVLHSSEQVFVLGTNVDQSNKAVDCALERPKEEVEMEEIAMMEVVKMTENNELQTNSGDEACWVRHGSTPSRNLKETESEQPVIIKEQKTTQSGEKPFCCDVCGAGFKHKHCLAIHKRIHTGHGLQKCDICKKALTTRGNLESHMRIHTGEKPFSCNICGKVFRLKSTLGCHMRTHTGEKPYQCNICGKSFTVICNLITHKRTHTGEKPFSCLTCGKGFCRKVSLKQHKCVQKSEVPHHSEPPAEASTQLSDQKTEKGEEAFTCGFCGRRFLRESSLSSHLKLLEVKPLICELCGQVFCQKHLLLQHRRTHC